jgi:thioredoxin-like negative regulator of GroEL
MKLGRADDALTVLAQAKDKGANGDEFDVLEQQLSEQRVKENQPDTIEAEGSSSSEPNILDSVKLERALKLAKQKSIEGQLEEARNIYEDILQNFHNSLLNETH